jgi:hypothetical protein
LLLLLLLLLLCLVHISFIRPLLLLLDLLGVVRIWLVSCNGCIALGLRRNPC